MLVLTTGTTSDAGCSCRFRDRRLLYIRGGLSVARARIEPIQINRKSPYPIKVAAPGKTYRIALLLAAFLLPRRVA